MCIFATYTLKTASIMKQQVTIGLCAIAVAIIVLGFCIKGGMDNFTFRDRTISARGVAEREVIANIGSGEVFFTIDNNDMTVLKNRSLANIGILRQFAIEQGIADSCITDIVPTINENTPNYEGVKPEFRYTANAGISIFTTDVKALHNFRNNLYRLTDKGLIANGYASYNYTGLNDIKPSMISEATHNARIAADRFATDSGSKIGLIKSANQGYFSIDAIEGKAPYYKNVRVVTSVEFYLND